MKRTRKTYMAPTVRIVRDDLEEDLLTGSAPLIIDPNQGVDDDDDDDEKGGGWVKGTTNLWDDVWE